MASGSKESPPEKLGPKWRRTGTPRSKTGCVTCRRRRVRCDEHHPSCLRCVAARIVCGGYVTAPVVSKPPCTNLPILLPRGSQGPRLINSGPSNMLSNLPFTQVEAEGRYFKYFQHKSDTGFDGMLDWSIWNNVVLQLTHLEPFIHDSVVAIGALSKSLEIDRCFLKSTMSDSVQSTKAKMHREFALLKYGKAIKAMQSVLVRAELRQVLVACLLVYSFEILLNNRYLALSHVVSGHRLLRGWRAGTVQGKAGNRRLLSPDPTKVDDEIFEAFERMDLQIMTICDVRPVELHLEEIREGFPLVQQMPSTFNDLREARGYLLVVMRRCYHFLATTWDTSKAGFLVRKFKISSSDNLVVTSGTNIYSTPYTVPSTRYSEQKEYADNISQWSSAFVRLYQKMRRPEVAGFGNYVVATLLRIHAITTTIVVAGLLFNDECSYDTFLPLFQELFALSSIIVDAYRKKSDLTPAEARFFLDLGITSPLYLLVTRCRDHSLRAGAIDLLRGWHTESCWQPQLIAGIGEFLMDVEEEGIDEGTTIPEKSRAHITAVCDGSEGEYRHEALVQCVQRNRGLEGHAVWHERRVRYKWFGTLTI